MPHPLWALRWRGIQRQVDDPATQVICFIRSVSPPERENRKAVEYILSKITRKLEGNKHGNPTGNECEQAEQTRQEAW